MAAAKKPGKGPPGKRGGSKPGRTRLAAALVVAARSERRPPPPAPGTAPEGEVHEGEFTEAPARGPEAPSSEDRARALVERVRHAGGRPSVLTRELITRTVKAVLDGASPKLALKAQGVGESTYLAWRRQGKDDLAKDEPELTLHAEFSLSIDAALGEFGQEAGEWLSQNRNTPSGKLSASNVTFLLGRRYADEYGQKQSLEVSGPEGGPVKVEAHTARETVFLEAASVLGPALTTAFLVEKKRWPSSVDEAQEWLAAREATAPPVGAT